MSYSNFSILTRSEKIVTCWIEPTQRFLLWENVSGSIYKRSSSRFVFLISNDVTPLTRALNSSLSSGEFYYDIESGEVFIRLADDSDPNDSIIVATLRLFYSTAPINLPWDLDTGGDVHYEGLLKTNSPVVKQLDYEQTGIALESNSTLTLENTSAHFDEIYDVLFFEYKRVRVYSWSDSIPLSEKELIFDGVIEDKSISTKDVKFKCKDFMYRLREPVPLDLFTTLDGSVSDTYLDTPKRRIYGQMEKVRCVPIDNILDGYTLTGTVSMPGISTTLTGSGTLFLDECSPGDTISIVLENETIEIDIESVDSDTQITVSDEIATAFSNEVAIDSPARPWRKKNRIWHVAGHKLRQPTTTVSAATQPNRLTVVDGSDIFAGDLINIDGEDAFVKRISGNNIVLIANLQGGTPLSGDVVFKNPISKAFFNSKEGFITRDWGYTNTTEAKLFITNDAELNLAVSRPIGGSVTFTNGSRSVTATGINLSVNIQTRDWIKSSDVNHDVYYEVLSVSESEITLREEYAGSTIVDTSSRYKAPELIGDNSYVTVNCIGMEHNGSWVKTGPEAVRNLVEVDAGQTVNSDSFLNSSDAAPFIISMVIPETLASSAPKIRNVVTKINESIMGSLINDGEWNLSYNILTPDRPTDLTPIEDHDILGDITVKSDNQIVRKINAKYRPFVDIFTNEDSFKLIEFENDFVDRFIGSSAEKDITIYLFNDKDAQEIAERYGLYNSLSQSIISVKSKLVFMLKNLNDKVYLNLDRLYRRFGGRDRRKIGIISKISKNGFDVNLEFNDLSNVFNRVFSIADDSSGDFTSATNDEKIVNGYVLDDNLEIPDTTDEDYIGSGLIG